jgi:hypothetical protein
MIGQPNAQTNVMGWMSGKQDEKVVSMMGASDGFSEIP